MVNMPLKDGSPPRLDEKHLAWTLHLYTKQQDSDLDDHLVEAGYPRAFGEFLSNLIQDGSEIDDWVADVFQIEVRFHGEGFWSIDGTLYTAEVMEDTLHNLIKERYEASRLIEP